MTRMIACMRFQPKSGKTDEMMKAIAEYIRDYPFTKSLRMGIIDLGTGEFALIGVHNSVDAFELCFPTKELDKITHSDNRRMAACLLKSGWKKNGRYTSGPKRNQTKYVRVSEEN